MRATRDISGNLVVTNVETFVRLLLALFVIGAVAIWFAPVPAKGAAGWTGVFALFGLALLAANERSSFVFDRSTGVVNWRKDTPFRHWAGQIPFGSITALSLEHAITNRRRSGARRLVIVTRDGPVPITTAYTGVGDKAERVGAAIQAYLAEVAHRTDLALIKS